MPNIFYQLQARYSDKRVVVLIDAIPDLESAKGYVAEYKKLGYNVSLVEVKVID